LNWILKSNDAETSEKSKEIFTGILACRIFKELYQRISKEEEIEKAQAIVVLRIAEYVKNNPRATENQLIDFVRSEFQKFGNTIQNL